jgi:hypothetical protein
MIMAKVGLASRRAANYNDDCQVCGVLMVEIARQRHHFDKDCFSFCNEDSVCQSKIGTRF